jgi:hypothetical protein
MHRRRVLSPYFIAMELLRTQLLDFRSIATEYPKLMPETQVPEPSPRNRTTLLKLSARQCRYVAADGGTEAIFCGGQTKEGSS